MDFNALGETAALTSASKNTIYPSRICQADADVFAYDCANLENSAKENFEELKKYIDDVRMMSGSARINLHLTMGVKGGRAEMATVKPYQENRGGRDPEIQARVWELRHMMVNYRTMTVNPVPWTHQEADDGMVQYQVARIKETQDIGSSVIYSLDKDLWMAMGLHQDVRSKEIYKVSGYGSAKYQDVGNKDPKLIGRGTCWFWYQMIMGDKADNIPGLPKLSGRLAERYIPLKKPNPNRTALACGEAKAYAMLKDVTSDAEACKRVTEAYLDYYGPLGYAHMFEQGFLLWMRRVDDELDLLKYWKEECDLPYSLTPKQKENLKLFTDLKQTLTVPEQTSDTLENT